MACTLVALAYSGHSVARILYSGGHKIAELDERDTSGQKAGQLGTHQIRMGWATSAASDHCDTALTNCNMLKRVT